MAEVEWIKVSTGMFGNRKIKQIERMPKGDTFLVIWLKLLTLAGTINDGGAVYVTPEVPYDMAMLADEFGRPEGVVKQAFSVFERFGMVRFDEAGFCRIPGWADHQNIEGLDKVREQNRLRQARFKAKAKEKAAGNDENSVTGNATEALPIALPIALGNALEEDGEGRFRKELHSFTLRERADDVPSGQNVENSASKEEAKRECMQGALGKGVVLMSPEQIDHLLEVLSIDEFNHYVTVVADAELAGKRYKKKTHYQAILDMAEADRGLARRRA